MTRPILLDLFCGAGGAAVGYHRAGFEVVGVDINHQPNYPFDYLQADALKVLDFMLEGSPVEVAAIHASPPCQAFTAMSNRWRGKGGAADRHPNLIGATRALLVRSGLPYVIENVPGAKRFMNPSVKLHGGMFGLRVHRPRLFESNVPMVQPLPESGPADAIGVYGKLDGRRLWTRQDGSIYRAAKTLDDARDAMGIEWMEWPELTEAIPPAYTEYIGKHLMNALEREAA